MSIFNKETYPIFKVCLLTDSTTIDTVLVFFGQRVDENEQAKQIPKVFTKEDLDDLDEETEINFIEDRIYMDDTVETIKIKILNALKDKVAYDEIYFFIKVKTNFEAEKVFALLTNEGTVPLDKKTFETFLLNTNLKVEVPFNKPVLSLDDLVSLNLEGKEVIAKCEPGNSFWVSKGIVDPFSFNKFFDSFSIDFFPNNVLLSSREIYRNNIYLSLAKDVLAYGEENENPSDQILSLYYPSLLNQEIDSLESLKAKTSILLQQNNKYLTPEYKSYDAVINLYHEIFYYRLQELPYEEKGIMKVVGLLEPISLVEISLETLFKNVHASNLLPLIKYTPSSGESQLRLFTNQNFSSQNNKYPSLPMERLKELNEIAGNEKDTITYVSVYSNQVFSLNAKGQIRFSIFVEEPITLVECNKLLKKSIEIIETDLNKFYSFSGFHFSPFTTIFQESVRITDMDILFSLSLNDITFSLDNNLCASKIFQTVDNTIYFTRVSAEEKGFPTTFALNDQLKQLTIKVQNINNSLYLHTIPIYIDSLLRMHVDKSSTKYPTDKINSICYGIAKVDTKSENESENEEIKKDISAKSFNFQEWLDWLKSFTWSYNRGVPKVDENEKNEKEETQQKEELDVFDEEEDEKGKEELEEKNEIEAKVSEQMPLFTRGSNFFSYGESDENEQQGGSKNQDDEKEIVVNDVETESDNEDDNDPENDNPLSIDVILKNYQNRFHGFSRICESSLKRQPIGLTNKELEEIIAKHPNFLREEDVLLYGQDQNFVCPRFWCPAKRIPLPPDEIEMDTEGRLIHPDCGEVFELFASETKSYPGLSENCLPCCFETYNEIDQKERKEKCKNSKNLISIEFPLPPDQWGYLPPALQQVFKKCVPEACMLRHGVEQSNNQSFLVALSDVLSLGTNEKNFSLQEMREKLKRSVNLDLFIQLQNGNLVHDFSPNQPVKEETKESLIDKYRETNLFKKIQGNLEKDYFIKVALAFDNYISFLSSPNVKIDYTFIWDLVCQPNVNLFGPEGINLIILDLPDNDITGNIHLICPSITNSSFTFSPKRKSIILLKQNNLFEPIYKRDDAENVTKLLTTKDPMVNKFFTKIVEPYVNMLCKPKQSLPFILKTKTPADLQTVLKELRHLGYTIEKEVLNFQNKVIGILAKTQDLHNGFVPCFPSGSTSANFVFMNDKSLWTSYSETFDFLRTVAENTTIPCLPKAKVIEDGLVVGLITEADQFVQISPPIEEADIPADLVVPTFSRSVFQLDQAEGVDENRVSTIESIKLETYFYSMFQRKLRENILTNGELQNGLENELKKVFVSNKTKLNAIISLLLTFIGPKIEFVVLPFLSPEVVSSCKTYGTEECELLLPKENLVTRKDNKLLYFTRFADELIRNKKRNAVFMNPRFFIPFQEIHANVNDNEMIVPESYFELQDKERKPESNDFLNKSTNFDTAEPIEEVDMDCVVYESKELSQENLWSFCFSRQNYKEIIFNCSSSFLTNVVNWRTSKQIVFDNLDFDSLRESLESQEIPVLFFLSKVENDSPKIVSTSNNISDTFCFVTVIDNTYRVVYDERTNNIFFPLSQIESSECLDNVYKAIQTPKDERKEEKPILQDMLAVNFNKNGGYTRKLRLKKLNKSKKQNIIRLKTLLT